MTPTLDLSLFPLQTRPDDQPRRPTPYSPPAQSHKESYERHSKQCACRPGQCSKNVVALLLGARFGALAEEDGVTTLTRGAPARDVRNADG